jgi:hypothetical protein
MRSTAVDTHQEPTKRAAYWALVRLACPQCYAQALPAFVAGLVRPNPECVTAATSSDSSDAIAEFNCGPFFGPSYMMVVTSSYAPLVTKDVVSGF